MQAIVFSLFFFSFLNICYTQNAGIGTSMPHESAILDVSSTEKGFLPPRMTTGQRNSISGAADGLVIYNISTNSLELKTSTGWIKLSSSSAVYMPSISIGTQQWMTKNLDVAFYRNGDPIPQITDPTQWAGLTTGAWCYYENDAVKGNTYGKIYNWYAVNDPRGLAPEGWHIPKQSEWTALVNSLGSTALAGQKMKEEGALHWPNLGVNKGNNNSGWTALPGGLRLENGVFDDGVNYGYWWSSTTSPGDPNLAINYFLYYSNSSLYGIASPKKRGLSVRCVRD